MRVAICEDDPAEAGSVSALVEAYGASHPGLALSCTVTASGAELLAEEAVFDLYLLDILLGEENGIDLARTLRRKGERGRIVFLTSSPDYALPAFSVNAAGYLLKPVDAQTLFSALDAAAEELELRRLQQRRQFSFRTPEGLYATTLDDLVYIEIMGHVPYYHLSDGVLRGSELRISFEESMAPLLKLGRFLRPHRSFLVNASRISSITAQSLLLDNGSSIPLARARAAGCG